VIKSQWGAKFFAPVQTGPWTHPASYTMGARSYSGQVARALTTLHHLALRWKEE